MSLSEKIEVIGRRAIIPTKHIQKAILELQEKGEVLKNGAFVINYKEMLEIFGSQLCSSQEINYAQMKKKIMNKTDLHCPNCNEELHLNIDFQLSKLCSSQKVKITFEPPDPNPHGVQWNKLCSESDSPTPIVDRAIRFYEETSKEKNEKH